MEDIKQNSVSNLVGPSYSAKIDFIQAYKKVNEKDLELSEKVKRLFELFPDLNPEQINELYDELYDKTQAHKKEQEGQQIE